MENKNNKVVYGSVNNIPSNYHSSDLRNFFSQFIETKGFNCFHFRHRPEKQISTNILSKTDPNNHIIKTFCCVFRTDPDHLDKLIFCYNKKHWLDKKGDSLPSVCHISKICASQDKEPEKQYKRRAEVKQIPVDREEFTEKDLSKLPELHPPDVMPNGNVGTPTCVFLELIQQCRLPPVIISKLGLTFPKTRTNRKYGDVPFDYGGDVIDLESSEEPVKSGKGHELLNEGEIIGEKSTNVGTSTNLNLSQNKTDNDAELQHAGKQKEKDKATEKWRKDPETKKRMNERIEEKLMGESDHSEGDDDSCEEWERHEALHDNPDNQERNDERLFENEIELKWEKGGSGLVFYTDAQYWKEEEGDFDEQTTDDWDVDMSVYYEKNGGDKDSRDFVSMRQSERWRDGTEKTDRFSLGFAKKRTKKNDKNMFKEPKIGKFEVHTKGIGRKLMEKQGWQEGQGIGASSGGISEALENEGQPPSIKTGLGYHGEKLSRNVAKPRTADRDVVIATIYDHPEDIQKKEPLLRRHDHYTIKYRDSVLFKKAEMKDS